MAVPSFVMVIPVLAASDLMALPSRCVTRDVLARIVTFLPPVAIDGFRQGLAWHLRRDGDLVVWHVADGMLAFAQ
jgi:hypothetical protein